MTGFLDPQIVLEKLNLKEGQIVAEFGAGSGSFTIPLAKKVQGGRVYAIDIQQEPLSALKSKAEMERLANIEIRLGDLEEPNSTKLPENYLDFVFIPNVLFQIENKEQVLKEASRILKEGGKVVVIDWLSQSPFGPKEKCVDPEALKKIAKDLNLKLEKEFEAGKYHYGLVFVKG
jgi:ubiquinone/menaquinone biosynthesis C-methylase UbiE